MLTLPTLAGDDRHARLPVAISNRRDGRQPDSSHRPPAPARFPHGTTGAGATTGSGAGAGVVGAAGAGGGAGAGDAKPVSAAPHTASSRIELGDGSAPKI